MVVNARGIIAQGLKEVHTLVHARTGLRAFRELVVPAAAAAFLAAALLEEQEVDQEHGG